MCFKGQCHPSTAGLVVCFDPFPCVLQKPLQAYQDACLLSGIDPTCMPWAHQSEAAIDAVYPAFRNGRIYHFCAPYPLLHNPTDTPAQEVLGQSCGALLQLFKTQVIGVC